MLLKIQENIDSLRNQIENGTERPHCLYHMLKRTEGTSREVIRTAIHFYGERAVDELADMITEITDSAQDINERKAELMERIAKDPGVKGYPLVPCMELCRSLFSEEEQRAICRCCPFAPNAEQMLCRRNAQKRALNAIWEQGGKNKPSREDRELYELYQKLGKERIIAEDAVSLLAQDLTERYTGKEPFFLPEITMYDNLKMDYPASAPAKALLQGAVKKQVAMMLGSETEPYKDELIRQLTERTRPYIAGTERIFCKEEDPVPFLKVRLTEKTLREGNLDFLCRNMEMMEDIQAEVYQAGSLWMEPVLIDSPGLEDAPAVLIGYPGRTSFRICFGLLQGTAFPLIRKWLTSEILVKYTLDGPLLVAMARDGVQRIRMDVGAPRNLYTMNTDKQGAYKSKESMETLLKGCPQPKSTGRGQTEELFRHLYRIGPQHSVLVTDHELLMWTNLLIPTEILTSRTGAFYHTDVFHSERTCLALLGHCTEDKAAQLTAEAGARYLLKGTAVMTLYFSIPKEAEGLETDILLSFLDEMYRNRVGQKNYVRILAVCKNAVVMMVPPSMRGGIENSIHEAACCVQDRFYLEYVDERYIEYKGDIN